jgi:Zn/Cd-binding protein ZinT
MNHYKITSPEQVDKINLEGKYVDLVLKSGEKLSDFVYYQGALDFDDLNANRGGKSIGYNYLYLEESDREVKYTEISEITLVPMEY